MRGSREKCVHDARRDSLTLCRLYGYSPLLRDRQIHRNNPPCKSRRQILLEPDSDAFASLSFQHSFKSPAHFRNRNHTDKNAILVRLSQPANHARMRLWLDPLRNYVGIEQKIQRSISRGFALSRLILRPEFRNGDSAKKSARLPLRFVFRSHSPASTTTTACRPLRVIICGPSCSASSINWLN